MPLPPATRAEEWANSITHGIGLVLSVVGLLALVGYALRTVEPVLTWGCAIFGASLVFMYTASTLYHSLRRPRLKRILRIIDHISIFVVIAGSYTPFMLRYLDGTEGAVLLGLEWGLALAGSIYKLFFTGRFPVFSTVLYIAMGILVLGVMEPLVAATPPGCLAWLVAGGACYLVGVVFYAWHRLPYHHAIWHVFVLGGSLCHYLALALYL